MKNILVILSVLLLTTTTVVAGSIGPLLTGMGNPPAPQPWHPTDWDVTILTDGPNSPVTLTAPMAADHGADCAPPPAQHTITNVDDTVFVCLNHLMTSMNAGYGAVYLTPNAMLDWTNGEAVLQWRMSTQRTSSRDWIDVTIQPFDTNMQIDYDDVHRPKDAIHMNMIGGGYPGGIFIPYIARNFVEDALNSDTFTSWRDVLRSHGLDTSAARRDLFELHVSKTHLKYGMPEYNFWPVDADMAPLSWTQGVIQFNHYSYNPEKACEFDGTCHPNTWHWSDVTINPAVPFDINRTDRRYVGPHTSNTLNLASPSLSGAKLRFYGVGRPITVSYNGGATWVTPTVPFPGGKEELPDNYWTDIPTGTTSVMFRGTQWFGGDWLVRDVAVWSQSGAVANPTNTPIAVPTQTPNVPTPTRTSTATSTTTPTATSTAVVVVPTATPSTQPTQIPTLQSTVQPTATPTPMVLPGMTCTLHIDQDGNVTGTCQTVQ